MKAYKVFDGSGYADYVLIVFAETRSKAIVAALGTDEFPYGEWEYTQLRARRVPELDKHYRGHSVMEWYNAEDRIAMVKEAGFRCDDDSFDPECCRSCPASSYCEKYAEYFEEENGERSCVVCEYCQMESDSGSEPHLRCNACFRDIVFNKENGMEVMKWCPMKGTRSDSQRL